MPDKVDFWQQLASIADRLERRLRFAAWLMIARYHRWLASGRLERLGPPQWRFHPEVPDLAAHAGDKRR